MLRNYNGAHTLSTSRRCPSLRVPEVVHSSYAHDHIRVEIAAKLGVRLLVLRVVLAGFDLLGDKTSLRIVNTGVCEINAHRDPMN